MVRNIKSRGVRCLFFAFVLCVLGCSNTMLTYNGPDVTKAGGGDYVISIDVFDYANKEGVRPISSPRIAYADGNLSVAQNVDSISREQMSGWTWRPGDTKVPVHFEFRRVLGDGHGALAHLNNLLSLCTVQIWPGYSSQDYNYSVTIKKCIKEERVHFSLTERSLTSSFIFGWIPVPGWADRRSYGFDKSSFPTFEDKVFRNIVYSYLTKSDYDAAKSKYDAALTDANLYEIATNKSMVAEEIRFDRAGLLKDESFIESFLMDCELGTNSTVSTLCAKIKHQDAFCRLAQGANNLEVRDYASHQLTNEQFLAEVLLNAADEKIVDGLSGRIADEVLLKRIALSAKLSSVREKAVLHIKGESNLADVLINTTDKEIVRGLAVKISDESVRQRVAREARLDATKIEMAEFLCDVSPAENFVGQLSVAARSNVCARTNNQQLLKRFAIGEFTTAFQETAIRRIMDSGVLYELYYSEELPRECKDLVYEVSGATCRHKIDAKNAELDRIEKEKIAAEREKKIQQIIARKRKEKLDRLAAERREARLQTPEYKALKKWYDGQLEYNDVVESWYQQCSEDLYFLRLDGPGGSCDIKYNRGAGFIGYPRSMTKGFAERLIKSRMRMQEIEEGK